MLRTARLLTALTALAFAAAPLAAQATTRFQGVKANAGTAIYTKEDGRRMLTLSDDFVLPAAPAPHWQVVDASGKVYLLQRLKIREDKVNKTIALPAYVADVAIVQIWCSFAETLLGEATFAAPVGGASTDIHRTSAFVGVAANKGYALHLRHGSQSLLEVSDDFVVPDAPAPHWQVVDSHGNVFLLNALKLKGDRVNRRVVVPDYVGDIVKVQIWCAFAEVLLGEATFHKAVM